MQGYLCSTPIPADEFVDWCKTWNRERAGGFAARLYPNAPQALQ
jgi:hypothetical protein